MRIFEFFYLDVFISLYINDTKHISGLFKDLMSTQVMLSGISFLCINFPHFQSKFELYNINFKGTFCYKVA